MGSQGRGVSKRVQRLEFLKDCSSYLTYFNRLQRGKGRSRENS